MNLENKKVGIKFDIIAIIIIILFCFSISPVTLQNDTFYTIRIGELILENGIDMQDNYSWHEDLAYTYPHWAYDVGLSIVYNLGEMTGIQEGGWLFVYLSTAILACVLGLLIYYTANKITKNKLISFLATIVAIYLLGDFIAARAQLVTYILFILTLLCIESYIDSKKKRYLIGLVLISIAIANIHVAVWPFFFVIFLPYVAEYIIACIAQSNFISKLVIKERELAIKRIENKIRKETDEVKLESLNKELEEAKEKLEKQMQKEEKVIANAEKRRETPYKLKIEKKPVVKWLILTMIICMFTGLLTPLGNVPYTYLIKTMQGNTMDSISEHLPLTLYNDISTMIVLVVFLVILIFTDTKIKLRDLFMLGGIIFLTFMSRRQVSMLILMGVFIFVKFLDYLLAKYDPEGTEKFLGYMTSILGRIITLAIAILICMLIIKPKIDDPYISKSKYPVEASTWILENLDIENMRIYNEYNYGSYLLYRGIPVFIDSRADLYAPEFNIREGEEKGRDIFSDYINTSSIGKYYENTFKDYDITHVILYNNAKLNMFISRDDNYTQLYKDDYFVIYERNAD